MRSPCASTSHGLILLFVGALMLSGPLSGNQRQALGDDTRVIADANETESVARLRCSMLHSAFSASIWQRVFPPRSWLTQASTLCGVRCRYSLMTRLM